jgi:hypothetical protein
MSGADPNISTSLAKSLPHPFPFSVHTLGVTWKRACERAFLRVRLNSSDRGAVTSLVSCDYERTSNGASESESSPQK